MQSVRQTIIKSSRKCPEILSSDNWNEFLWPDEAKWTEIDCTTNYLCINLHD